MAIIGIGTDLIEIKRIEAVVFRNGNQFARRILSPVEWLQYQQYNHSVRFLAKRFAAKEAASKALGIGIQNGLFFKHFEIYNDKLGKPYLQLFSRAKELANQFGITNIHVSLADEKHYAYATVIFER